jgi:hypothetical protein
MGDRARLHGKDDGGTGIAGTIVVGTVLGKQRKGEKAMSRNKFSDLAYEAFEA